MNKIFLALPLVLIIFLGGCITPETCEDKGGVLCDFRCSGKFVKVGDTRCCFGECLKNCPDGTPSTRCSRERPLFCESGELIEECEVCGCPIGNICVEGKCIGIECKEGRVIACGIGTGACGKGLKHCVDNEWGPCEGIIEPEDEICDRRDNDCDGQIDEGCECKIGDIRECGSDVGECNKGIQSCKYGVWGNCIGDLEPEDEICDGRDNDCDDEIDEGCECKIGDIRECGSDVGECNKGIQSCKYGVWGNCIGDLEPEDEICNNGLDDDCDGETDEDCSTTETCSQQNGFICFENEDCHGTWLTASDTGRCCDIECTTPTKELHLMFGILDQTTVDIANKYALEDDFIVAKLRERYIELLENVSKGRRMIIAPSINNFTEKIELVRSVNPEYLAYDIEHGTDATEEEKADPVAAVKAVYDFAHENGFELMAGTDSAWLDDFGAQMANYADMFLIMCGSCQVNNPKDCDKPVYVNCTKEENEAYFEEECTRRIQIIKTANPNIPIFVQINTYSNRGKPWGREVTLEEMIISTNSISGLIDGISVYVPGGTNTTDLWEQYAQWMRD